MSGSGVLFSQELIWKPSFQGPSGREGNSSTLGGMAANGLSQFINRRALIVNRKLRVANDVDEQDMGDLELDLFLNFSGHARKLFRRGRGDEFLEAGVATQQIEVGIEPQQGGSKRMKIRDL